MKKLLIAILLIILAICMGMIFAGCGVENGYHDGHPNIASWVVVKEPTCSEQGEKRFKCQICGKDLGFANIDQLGHDYGDYTSNGDGTHSKTCTRDNSHVVIEKCSGGTATETAKAECSICGQPYGETLEEQVTEGLEFILIKKDTEYEVSGYTGSSTEVNIPSTYKGKPVTSIGEQTFFNCNTLIRVEIPNSITSIGKGAFGYCSSLTSINIPNSVIYIDEVAFIRCHKLSNIEVAENNKYYKSIDGNLYSKDETILIKYAIGKNNTSFAIPNSITNIGYDAFDSCSSLISITIPNSATFIGEYAFYNCSSLKNIIIPITVITIGNYAFAYCKTLKSVEIGNGVTIVGKYAFDGCFKLIEVTLGEALETIDESAFS